MMPRRTRSRSALVYDGTNPDHRAAARAANQLEDTMTLTDHDDDTVLGRVDLGSCAECAAPATTIQDRPLCDDHLDQRWDPDLADPRPVDRLRACAVCDGPGYETGVANVDEDGDRIDCPLHGENGGRPVATLPADKRDAFDLAADALEAVEGGADPTPADEAARAAAEQSRTDVWQADPDSVHPLGVPNQPDPEEDTMSTKTTTRPATRKPATKATAKKAPATKAPAAKKATPAKKAPAKATATKGTGSTPMISDAELAAEVKAYRKANPTASRASFVKSVQASGRKLRAARVVGPWAEAAPKA